MSDHGVPGAVAPGNGKPSVLDRSTIASVMQWDDHEVTNNWSLSKQLPAAYKERDITLLAARAARAFHEMYPMRESIVEPGRVYRTLNYGPHLDVFMTQACKDKYPAGFETWAVGYYNEWGGVAFGKAIPKSGQPQTADYMGTQMPAGLPFPPGTVVVKFLTTNAPPDCVPYLKGSPEWQIDRHVLNEATQKYTCTRAVQISRIVQVDVAVTDARSPTGWVYGTYAYDAGQSGTTFWDHLLPLGIQFGSDPWTFPAVPKAESVPAQQSVLNPGVKIYEHFGCNNRLAGPVDNSQSSCMSCHGSAFAAPKGAVSNMSQISGRGHS